MFATENFAQRALDHWIVAYRQQHPDVGLETHAGLPPCVGITEFKAGALVDRPTVHYDEQNVAFFDGRNIGFEYPSLRNLDRDAVLDEIDEEKAIVLRNVDVGHVG